MQQQKAPSGKQQKSLEKEATSYSMREKPLHTAIYGRTGQPTFAASILPCHVVGRDKC